jgi:hypothetical protein
LQGIAIIATPIRDRRCLDRIPDKELERTPAAVLAGFFIGRRVWIWIFKNQTGW